MANTRPGGEEPAVRNIGRVAELIRAQQHQSSRGERVASSISRVVGTLGFVAAHVVLFVSWAAWNSMGPDPWRFDPYPYGLLTMCVSMEGVLVAVFVLVNQNRLQVLADKRDHLHLQIDLLAEQEITAVLRLLGDLSRHLKVPASEIDEQLSEETDVGRLLTEIERRVPVD